MALAARLPPAQRSVERLTHEMLDFGGDRAEAGPRTERAEAVDALDDVALDLTDTKEMEVSLSASARKLQNLLVHSIADDTTGERLRLRLLRISAALMQPQPTLANGEIKPGLVFHGRALQRGVDLLNVNALVLHGLDGVGPESRRAIANSVICCPHPFGRK